MKKLFILTLLFGYFSNAQEENLFDENDCTMSSQSVNPPKGKGNKSSTNCLHTSDYWSNEDAYVPNELNNVIYVRLNVIFPTKPDGTGNFEENNAEHIAFLDDVYNRLNHRMSHLVNLPTGSGGSCIVTAPENFISNIKIQYVINKIFVVDPGWDSLTSTFQWVNDPYNPLAEHVSGESHAETDGSFYSTLYPPHPNYYFNTLSNQILNDPNIPKGINIFYPNIGYLYDDLVRDQNHNNYIFTDSEGHTDSYMDTNGWSASQSPTSTNLDRFSNMTLNNHFLNYYFFKHILPQNYHYSQYNFEDNFRGWLVGNYSGGLMHEIGHSYDLSHYECNGHCNNCYEHVMNQGGTKPRNYLTPNDISEMYKALSLTNMRNFVTEDSYTGTSIEVSSNETWDLDWRIYSDVVVETGNELRITCKTIMPPQSQIIVQDGASLILDGGVIESADGQNWEGIQLEGSGFFEILQETPEIENEYFYAYIESLRVSDDLIVEEVQKLELEKTENKEKKYLLKVYPNPSNDFISIVSTNEFSSFEIFDLKNNNLVLHVDHQGKASSLDISNFKEGVYLIKVFTKNKILYSKFIKN